MYDHLIAVYSADICMLLVDLLVHISREVKFDFLPSVSFRYSGSCVFNEITCKSRSLRILWVIWKKDNLLWSTPKPLRSLENQPHFPAKSARTSKLRQRAKKVVSDSPGLVDFAIGLVILFLTCPMGKCFLGGKFKLQKDCNQSC